MKITTVKSFSDLQETISGAERAFLLLYKAGSAQSECALERFGNVLNRTENPVCAADVNEVRDIHQELRVTSAPSLVVFKQGRVTNVIKGCQTESAYGSILAGREIGTLKGAAGQKQKQVTVYTTPTCSWCTTLKTYLKQQNVTFREINVAADSSAAERMVRMSGQQGVPQTEINGQMIVGFDKTRINQLLELN